MFRKGIIVSLMVSVVVAAGLGLAGTQAGDEAYQKILDGNKRFVSGSLAVKDVGDAKRKELTSGQRPFAIVVTCSDSRVAPEIVFDQGLGDIFVVRVAGNVFDPVTLGSVEYAAEHLHAPLLVLMGHDKCGAVSAALDAKGEPEGNIGAIVKKILPAVKKAKAKGGSKDELLANAVKENVLLSYSSLLKQSPVLKRLIHEGELKVAAGIYHLAGGELELLSLEAPVAEKQPAHAH